MQGTIERETERYFTTTNITTGGDVPGLSCADRFMDVIGGCLVGVFAGTNGRTGRNRASLFIGNVFITLSVTREESAGAGNEAFVL